MQLIIVKTRAVDQLHHGRGGRCPKLGAVSDWANWGEAAGYESTTATRILTACVNTASALVLGCLLGNPPPAVESFLCLVQVFGEAQGLLYLTAMIQQIQTQSFALQMEDFFALCLIFFLQTSF